MKNENEQYSFTFEYPVEYEQQTSQRRNNAEMKKFIRRAIAICCAVCLLVGGGVGIAVGTLVNHNRQDKAEAPESGYSEDVDRTIKIPGDDKEKTPDTAVKKRESKNLLYTADADAEDMSVSEIVEKVENTVVAISVEIETTMQYYFETYSRITQASGSGVIVSPDGYIVTNNHVIEGSRSINVALADGTSYEAKLIGADPETDLAIIKIEADGLDFAECGDDTTLKKGELAVVIGNPLGFLDGSVSRGIISAMGRTLNFADGTTLYNLIQTDASVNPGNSGGGLFNSKGQLVGVICAKSSADNVEGLGFAIPITTVYEVTQDLMDYGYVTGRPALGINTLVVNDYMTAIYYKLEYLGVYVQSFVTAEAEKGSELQIGDCLISIEDKDITGLADIAEVLSEHEVGDVVSVKVFRDGEEMTVKTTLVERTADYKN